MRKPIKWSGKIRTRKADGGHSVVRVGTGQRRTYAECQCGKVYSGLGWDGADRSHRKHVQRVQAGA